MRKFYKMLSKLAAFSLLIGMAGFWAGCGGSRSELDWQSTQGKFIRVGIVQGRQSVQFIVGGEGRLTAPDGRTLVRMASGSRWYARAVAATPVGAKYYLSYATVDTRDRAQEKGYELTAKNYPWKIQESGALQTAASLYASGKGIFHVVLKHAFADRASAETVQAQLADRLSLQVVGIGEYSAAAEIEIRDAAGSKTYKALPGSQLRAEQITLLDLRVGTGFHFAESEDQIFRGTLEFMAKPGAGLTIVNILPFEHYLRGVVPAEMHPDFPLEALKAQAVAARSQVLAKIGRHAEDGFDICATVHCQMYRGIGLERESSTSAVTETAGLVLFAGDKPLDAVYSSVCGGHTENNENVWNGAPQAVLRGVFDGKGSPDLLQGALENEEVVAKWVESRPPVFCNTIDAPAPESMVFTQKYFRWQTQESRTDLEQFIKKETKRDPGTLINILPKRRGVSGRLLRVEIVGALARFEIHGELTIRRALGAAPLYSACFTVERQLGEDNLPARFIFRGAGWGHGVGMCQTGAGMMALQGYPFEQILQHYYRGSRLVKMEELATFSLSGTGAAATGFY